MLGFCLRTLTPWRWQIWLGLGLILAQLGATLGLLPLARQLEANLEHFQLLRLWQLLAMTCGLFALRNLLEYLYLLNFSRLASVWAVRLRSRAFARLLGSDWQQLQHIEPDDLLTSLSDDLDKLRMGVQALLQRLLPSLLLLSALGAGLLLLSWPLTLLLLVAVPLGAGAVRWTGRALARHGASTQGQLARLFQELNESLQQSQLIRLYRQEARQQQRLDRVQQDWIGAQLQAQAWQMLDRPLLASLQVVTIALLLAFSAWLVDIGWLGGGDLLTYATALALAVDPGLWAAEAWGQIQLARPSWQRLQRLLELPQQGLERREPSATGLIEIRQLGCSRGGQPLFADLNLELEPGCKIGLAGPSGTGKSTLLGLLAGLEAPQQGSILWPAGWGEDAVLLVPQRAGLFNRSLRENLCLDREYPESRLWEVLEICGLAERMRQLPQGLDTGLGARGTWLSGGERQRVALARALLRQPRCLLLDEATSELDVAIEALILTRIRQDWPSLSWILVSHRRESLQQCEAVWHLEAGKLTGDRQCHPPSNKP